MLIIKSYSEKKLAGLISFIITINIILNFTFKPSTPFIQGIVLISETPNPGPKNPGPTKEQSSGNVTKVPELCW